MARGLPLQDAITVAQESLVDVEGSLLQIRTRRNSSAGRSTASSPDRPDEISSAALTVREIIEELDPVFKFLRASGGSYEPAREVLRKMLDVGVSIARLCHTSNQATHTGVAMAVALQTARRLPMVPSISTVAAEKAMADVFLQLHAPAWTSDGTARNVLTQTNDLLSLSRLDGTSLCWALQQRFERRAAYAYAGDITVFVNPCHDIGNTCDEIQCAYRMEGDEKRLPPHLFAMVDRVLIQARAVENPATRATHPSPVLAPLSLYYPAL